MVERANHFRGQTRMPEGIIHGMATEVNTICHCADSSERRPKLKYRLGAVEMSILHMARYPNIIEAQAFGELRHLECVSKSG